MPDSHPEYNPLDPNDKLYGSQENATGIKPLGYKLLLELPVPAEIRRAKESGVAIPETAEERHTQAAVVAKVIQVGAGCYRPERFPEGPWVFPGQHVLMSPYNGVRVHSPITGLDYRLINEDSVEAVVPGAEYAERG